VQDHIAIDAVCQNHAFSAMSLKINDIELHLGTHAGLLIHKCETIHKEALHLPSPNVVDTVYAQSNRNNNVLRSLQAIKASFSSIS
jgi:class I fructose-bisphosphate aldolase